MGLYLTYLSKPVTEKVSSDEANDKIKCGASSMQGWRENQEDAHNCILDYDTDTSFFAVYDGHGGHEVAVYTSQKFPQFIKDSEAYKNGDFEQALITSFLNFDGTLVQPEIIEELKKIAGERDSMAEDDEDEDVSSLFEEASMPIEKVIERYKARLLKTKVKSEEDNVDETSKNEKCETTVKENCSSSSDASETCDNGISKTSDKNSKKADVPATSSVNAVSSTTISSDSISSTSLKSDGDISISSSVQNETSKSEADAASIENTNVNGVTSQNQEESCQEQSEKVGSSTSQENGIKSNQDNESTKNDEENSVRTRPKRNRTIKETNDISSELMSDSEDEEDKTFLGSLEEESSSDEDDIINSTIEGEDGEELDDDEELDEDDDDDDDLEEEEEEDEESMAFQKNMKDEPGSGSGCTAVVALLKENQLYVANAGDSRCVVCRNGKAVEMSFDHKPEDEPEKERIVKAGGKVTADGRVNGGLNLSRAFGDHAYKQNTTLSDREQMITALPDIRKLTISPGEDEFMVLACDGIWNSMSNQEVVDFVKTRIDKGVNEMSHICEELFDACLAPNTKNDGTGCDNMTAIIVQFKTNKRSAPDDEEKSTDNAKRVKTDNEKECSTSS